MTIHPRESGVRVRPAVEEDLAAICRIESESFADPWSRRSFRGLLTSPAAFFLVAQGASGEPVGYAVGFVAADEAELSNIAVDAGWRRSGVGRALLGEALAWARLRGAAAFYLDVREGNSAALALYAQEGFDQVGRRARYYVRPQEDALVLRKALAPYAGI